VTAVDQRVTAVVFHRRVYVCVVFWVLGCCQIVG
jgi:hypothetical protein